MVRFAPGERVRLQSGPSDSQNLLGGGADTLDIMQFRVAGHLDPGGELGARLVEVPRLEPNDASVRRNFDMAGYSLDGQTMDMSRIDAVVELGTTELWTVTNLDGATPNFHVHDVQFQILDIGGEQPPPELGGWKDTVWLPPNAPVRLIMRFTDYASTTAAYMMHCHILRHEDEGLMGQFLVVEPGESTEPADYRLDSANHEHEDDEAVAAGHSQDAHDGHN